MSFAESQIAARWRSRRAFVNTTASAGEPKPTPRRVLTSQKTSVSPCQAMMSTSPAAQRQLRASIR
jgi:hypothetical protein